MTAVALPRSFPADAFCIFDPEDRYHAQLCYGEADAREIISGIKNTSGIRVHRITLDEISRDVTADFFPEEDEAPEYPINRTTAMRRAGAFG